MYKLKDIDLRVPYGQDFRFGVVPVQSDGYRPDPKSLVFSGFVYRPYDEINRYIEPIEVKNGIAIIKDNPERPRNYHYRYNIFVIETQGGRQNRRVIQTGNVDIINEFREPN